MPASEISVIDQPVWAEEGVGDAGVPEGPCLARRSVHADGHLGGMEWHLQRYSLRGGGSVDSRGEWQSGKVPFCRGLHHARDEAWALAQLGHDEARQRVAHNQEKE